MSREDWVENAENEWYKPNTKYSFARVWKIGLSSKERKRRGILVWGFEGRIGREGSTTKKYFKREPEAVRFAEAYMRTH